MESLYLFLLVVVMSLLIFKLLNRSHGTKRLPPGPKPWPLIGNFNLIGSLPHQSFHKLSKIYGQLMYIKLGSTPVVIASSPDMAKQILKTHDRIFASRPVTHAAGKYTAYNNRDVTWCPYGPHWSLGRKIFVNEIFSRSRLSSFEYIRLEEIQALLSRLHSVSGKGGSVVLRDHLSRTTLSVICRIVLGRDYFSDSTYEKDIATRSEVQEMVDELFLLNGVFNFGDWIPWLRYMDLQGYVKRMKALFTRFDKFYDHVVDEHKARINDQGKGFVAKDMVDVLLNLANDHNLEVKLDSEAIKGFTQDLIAGGTDTASKTVEWAMSELIKRPYLMKKATDELDRVVGRQRWVQEVDFPDLPFIDSIVKETMRLHPAAALLAPHVALEDCRVAGYDIAKGTIVFVNTWSMGRDSDIWDDPLIFRPERFLGKVTDVNGHHFEFLPFGSGRRMCPGYKLGLKMMKLILGNLLHGFNWKLPENIKLEDLDMEEVYGLTTQRKFPLVAVPKPRLPSHMYNQLNLVDKHLDST